MRNVVLAARKKTIATVSVSWLCKSYAKSGRALWGTEADVCRRWPRGPLYRAWGVRRDASDTAERVGKARPADRPSCHTRHTVFDDRMAEIGRCVDQRTLSRR